MRVAIDTGFSARILDAVLDELGWRGRVDAAVASDEVRLGRPAPDLIHEAVRRCAVDDVTRVAKVEDTPADLGEGMRAGCGWTLGVTYGTHSRAELAAHPHIALVDDLDAVGEVLGRTTSQVRRRRPGSRTST